MIDVKRESKNWICISCGDRDSKTHDIRIGAEDNNKTVITLCPKCLDDLYNEIAETLNY
jgi:RNase P subunit RPR2